MARILLFATTTGYQTRAFGEAAERLGVELVFATDRCEQIDDPWQDGAIPIRFHEEARSVSTVVDAARTRGIDGLLVVGDRPTLIAARVAQALGLPGHPPAAAAAAGHKQKTRECLKDAGLPTPWFRSAAIGDDARALAAAVSFPCVVKPLALSGSRGVMRADDPDGFVAAVERLRALLRSPEIRAERSAANDEMMVEGFIPGREYALEGLLHRGALEALAIFDKPDPLDGPFFEETIYVTPSSASDRVQEAIVNRVAQAAAAIGLHHGPVHAECRVNDAGVFVLEVAARPIGGLCARALRFDRPGTSESSSLEELLLRHAVGESPGGWRRERDASGVMMIPIPRRGVLRGVEGVDGALRVPFVTEIRITAKMDQLLVPLPEGASYLGFVFARAVDAQSVEGALRGGHSKLAFRIDPDVHVLGRSQIHYNHAHG